MTIRKSAFGLLCAMLVQAAPVHAAASQTEMIFVGGDDGYGTSACLADGSSCGQIVADALCQSRSFAHALSFRQAEPDEITASIGAGPRNAVIFAIQCSK